jgi:phosphopantothenoylcysteine decarboxylase
VASIKATELAQELLNAHAEVRVVASKQAAHFFSLRELEDLLAGQHQFTPAVRDTSALLLRPPVDRVDGTGPYEWYVPNSQHGPRVNFDVDEWLLWQSYARGDPVLHIALRDWADALVVAPASASFLSGSSSGQCYDLATCIVRAWHRSKPIVLAPAMNTAMWEHPATARHLRQFGLDFPATVVVPPQAKRLACGDVGVGAMARPDLVARTAAIVAGAAWAAERAGASPGTPFVMPPLPPTVATPAAFLADCSGGVFGGLLSWCSGGVRWAASLAAAAAVGAAIALALAPAPHAR